MSLQERRIIYGGDMFAVYHCIILCLTELQYYYGISIWWQLVGDLLHTTADLAPDLIWLQQEGG